MAITVKDFIMSAIKEGVAEAPIIYMQQLERQLQTDVRIQESGNASLHLQKLINEAEEKVNDTN
jgi:hypothetical protein